jgi:PIN domain nuclease of toxin-antitoxin system
MPARVRRFIGASDNELFLSAATAWEIAIKQQIGRLQLDRSAREYVAYYAHQLSLRPLDVTTNHALAVADLPLHHSDPFDRLLIAQARIEDLSIVTADSAIGHYDVRTIWQ